MANPSDIGGSNPYSYGSDPMTDPNAGNFTYTPPPPAPTPYNDMTGAGSTPYVTSPALGPPSVSSQTPAFNNTTHPGSQPAPQTYGGPTTQTGAAPSGPAANPASQNWGDIFNPPWMGKQSQQWLDFMMGPQGVQFQNQLAQQQEDLQKQIQTAAYTGDWAGMQTLQGQLQNVQIELAKNQAQVNDTLAQSNLTGSYHGAPTLQAQDIMNNLALQARGQDVTMAGIQAQLAQSPLVAWYTARGLPPPQSAIMSGPAAWNPDWNWSERGGIAPTGWSSVQDQVPLPPGVTPAA